MNGFQKGVIIVAGIVLVVLLIAVGVGLRSSTDNETWPPNVGDCPDYWVDTSGNGGNCVNVKYLGSCAGNRDSNSSLTNQYANAQTVNFSVAPFTGTTGTCNKYKWANACHVTWDGITGTDYNPCNTNK
jgi:hypothetical protein